MAYSRSRLCLLAGAAFLASLSLASLASAQKAAAADEPADWPLAHLSLSFGLTAPVGSDGFNDALSDAGYSRMAVGGYWSLAFDGAVGTVELSPTARFRVLLGAAFEYDFVEAHDAVGGHFENLYGYRSRPGMWRHDLAGLATIAPSFVFAGSSVKGVELQLQLGVGAGGRIWEMRNATETAPLLHVSARFGLSYFQHGFSAGIIVGYRYARSLAPIGPERLDVSLNAVWIGPRLGWRW